MASFLEVESLTVTFGGTRAVDDISLSVDSGEIFGVVGPNGAGKTSLLNGISRLVPLSSGAVRVDGMAIHTKRAHHLARHGIARTFQAAEVFNDFRVVDYLMLGRFSGQNSSLLAAATYLPWVRRAESADRQQAMELLEQFGLAPAARLLLKALPYGQRKLVDVLRAQLGAPRLLLLDEPTSGSAIEHRTVLRQILAEGQSRGMTILVIDHDVSFVSDMCNRLLVMNFGRELGIGTPADVMSRRDVQAAYTGLEREAVAE